MSITQLLHILHVHTNISSIQWSSIDNCVFVKFYAYSFCIKNAITKKVLLYDISKNRLYTIQGGLCELHLNINLLKCIISGIRGFIIHPFVTIMKVLQLNGIGISNNTKDSSFCTIYQTLKLISNSLNILILDVLKLLNYCTLSLELSKIDLGMYFHCHHIIVVNDEFFSSLERHYLIH